MNAFSRGLVFILFLSGWASLDAQTEIQAGAGLSFMYTNHPLINPADYPVSGYHVGGRMRLGKDRLFFQTGLDFHVLKMEAKSSIDPFASGASFYMLKVPVTAGYKVFRNDHFGIYPLAGVQAGFVTEADQNELGVNRKDLKDTSFGLLLGGGVDLGILRVSVIFEKGLGSFYTDSDYQSDFIQISLGFQL